jgi:hypothetical protein
MSDPVRREQLLAKALQEGKFPPGRVDHYRALYETDPTGTEKLVAALEPGLLPGEFESLQASVAAGTAHASAGSDPFALDPEAGTGRIFKAMDA